MRDDERPRRKPPGEFRILALGGSWTFGAGADQHESWPQRLEAAVREAGFRRIDLRETFPPDAGRETEIGLGGRAGATHPGPAGHALIARGVAAELESRGLPPP